MKKIEFKTDKTFGRHENPIEEKYTLLSSFIGQYRFPNNIQEIIDLLESVRSGRKTFAEATEPYGNILQIGYNIGELKCNNTTAFFISDNPETHPSMEMSLQELIDVLKDWKVFMS